jgi:NitT/TauT family transport system substrate-binding protein
MPAFFRVLILVAAVLVSGGAEAADPAPVKIRFGDLGASVNNLFQYLAVEKGIYRRHGIELEITDFLQGGPEAVAAAVSGQIDLGSAGTPVLSAVSRGLPIKVVGSPPNKRQPFILVSRPEITDVAQLKGKLVGFSSVGGGSLQAMHYILKAHGLAADDIQTIAFGTGPNGYLALKSGKLAAAVTAEPYATKAERDGIGRILAEADRYFDHYQHSYVFANRAFLKANPDAVRAYFRATREAVRYARDHQDELVAFGHKKLSMDEGLLRSVLAKTFPKWDDSFAVDTEGLLTAIRIVQELGDIAKTYRPDPDQIVDARYLD